MRASDLIGARVEDEQGRHIGDVHDLTVVQDGPLGAGMQAGFRVDRLVVGRGSLAHRLGYERGGVRGPWLVRVLFAWREQRGQSVAWADVVGRDETSRTLVVRSGAIGESA